MSTVPEQGSDALVVDGGRPLSGTIDVQGNKHGMVLGYAAAVAAGAELVLDGVPAVSERSVLSGLFGALGGSAECSGATVVLRGQLSAGAVPAELSRAIHGSTYLVPAIVAQRGEVRFSGSGGDSLGRFDHGAGRPMSHMLEAMACFGARWSFPSATELRVTCPRLRPAEVDIARWSADRHRPAGPFVSGATKTALLMAAAAPGTSVIHNPHAREAEHELIAMLRHLGADIEQRDGCWIVRGGRCGGRARYRLMPDPADLITWQAISVLTGSSLVARCAGTASVGAALRPERRFLAELGVVPRFGDGYVELHPAAGPFPGAALVAESTGVSTDAAPLLAAMLLQATSPSVVTDRVWHGRFGYAEQLNRLNARCGVADDTLVIQPSVLQPSTRPLTPADTRSAAVCLVAALAVPGRTTITGVEHLRRGYERLVPRLAAVGASVEVAELAPCAV